MSLSTPSAPSNRIAELDALRGLAALMVVLYHSLTRFQEEYGRLHPATLDFTVGSYAVWLFFMLSGYVILMTLDRTRSLPDFLVSRFSRLFPAFWAIVIVTYVVVHFWGLPRQAVSPQEALLNLTMLPRVLGAEFVDQAYWSLEPELFFYVCMGVLFTLGNLKTIRLKLALWLALAAVGQLTLMYVEDGTPVYRLVGRAKGVFCLEYMHLFAIGMIFYDVRRAGAWTRGHLALLAAAFSMTFWVTKWQEAAVTVGLAGVLYLATTGRLPILQARPLLWLGFISYPLYLIHQAMGYIALYRLDHLGWNPYLAVAVVTLGAIALAAVFSYTVEYPVMRLIRSAMKKRLRSAANALPPNAQPAMPHASL